MVGRPRSAAAASAAAARRVAARASQAARDEASAAEVSSRPRRRRTTTTTAAAATATRPKSASAAMTKTMKNSPFGPGQGSVFGPKIPARVPAAFEAAGWGGLQVESLFDPRLER